MILRRVCVVLLAVLSLSAAPRRGVREILQSYVDDYRRDPQAATPITFSIRIKDDSTWHVVVAGKNDVTLHEGLPATPLLGFVLDRATLERLDRGQLNALTAMGKARDSDAAPMDFDAPAGAQPSDESVRAFLPLIFHFWTRGTPEIVPFGPTLTRPLHGGHVVLFYYQPGVRYGWFHLVRGDHVNADPRDQTNPFPTIVVVTRGRCTAKIGGKTTELRAGQMLFIPANTTHEVWNDRRQPAEGTLLMFGEGA
ncbi:MAG TPA: cupin domain-containing protein [Thermoanaerobaculia bacterium]|jgi:hypothetical protein